MLYKIIRYYLKGILSNIIRNCSCKYIVGGDKIKTVCVTSENVSFFCLSSNPIKLISKENTIFYFRECREHKDYRHFVLETLDKFYYIAKSKALNDNFDQYIPIKQSFTEAYVSSFKMYIELCIREYDLINKMKSISSVLEKKCFSIWDGNYCFTKDELECLGLQKFPNAFNDILPLFLLYMRSGTNGWKGRKGTFECYNACRSIGSAKVAQLLGAENIYTSAELIRLQIDNAQELGVLSNKAPGMRAMDVTAQPTPSLQRQLSTLNLIDVLCYQPDHWVNNYNIILDEDGKAVDVCAFDNDNGKTFFPFGDINVSCYHGGCSFIDKQGLISMPHLDRNIADSLMSLSFSEIKKELSPYLNRLQLFAIGYRLFLLKKAIQKTSLVRKNFLLHPFEFNTDTLTDELSGRYGNTYLFQYVNKPIHKL